jgi:hypothetical protein
MPHLMPAPRKLTRELELERMSAIVMKRDSASRDAF